MQEKEDGIPSAWQGRNTVVLLHAMESMCCWWWSCGKDTSLIRFSSTHQHHLHIRHGDAVVMLHHNGPPAFQLAVSLTICFPRLLLRGPAGR